jgi:Argininosuccinate lyase
MPQKKNPDPAELIRGRTAINYGNLNSMLTIMKGLPISYYKDLQDDKELVFDSFDTLKDSLSMSIELIDNLNTKKNNMKNMAQKGYTTATDFADYLSQKKNLPFRKGYAISSKLVNYAEREKIRLDQLSLKEINKFIKNTNINIPKIFDVVNSMNSKTSYGGTSTKNIRKMIKKYKSYLN